MPNKLQVIATILIRPKQKELIVAAIKACTNETRKEAGCISYQAYISNDQPDRVVFIETWLNAHALELHKQMPHFTKMIEAITPYLARTFEVETLVEI